jgi:aspartyl-tRNA(Asn)/glutamyl-tRNA(Gln) amidotransferase subunit A
VTRNLFDAGGIMLGKCSLDEFAMGSSNTTSYFGDVKNPIDNPNGDTPLVPGGSSGASAAAVAARIAMGATGTDTGGSIRQPASFCGVTGIKPTYGRCSRWGIIAFASSLDQAGPIARSVTDCAILLQAMAGYDEKDSTSVNMPVPDFKAMVDDGVDGMTIGIPEEYRVDGIPDEINQMWEDGIDWLKSAGAKVKNISLSHTEHALATYYIIAPAEASSNLARYDGVRYGLRVDGDDLIDTYQNTRSEGFGDEVQRRIMIGTYVLSAGYYDAYYNQARRVRSLIAQDFTDAFENGIDAILTPTAPTAAFEIGANTDDPVQMYLNDIFTIPTSLAGLPGMSVPAGRDSDGLPLGLQIIGRPFDEETVFRVGREIERAADMPNGVNE